jgi:predicted MPP superfamily phosphohydrolase
LDNRKFLPETLAILSGIKSPLFGVPGNRDYLSGIAFKPVQQCFAATGGAWLVDECRELADGRINLMGTTCSHGWESRLPLKSQAKNILLMHYPAWAKKLGSQKLDLMLAGHSHGGQVRIPFYGPLILPSQVDEYNLGFFQTPSGPLYATAGIGYLCHYKFRLNCRPEITLIEV